MSKLIRQTMATLVMMAVVSAGAIGVFAQGKGRGREDRPTKPPVKIIDGKKEGRPPQPPPKPPKEKKKP
jgi:hypothetical protein